MVRDREKGIFLTRNSLETPRPSGLKTHLIEKVSHTNHTLPRDFIIWTVKFHNIDC